MLPKVKTVTKERPSLYPPGEPRGSSLPQRAATFDSAYAQIARSAPVGKQDLSMLSASTASATEKDHHETNFYLFDERDSQEQSKSTLFGDYDASIEPVCLGIFEKLELIFRPLGNGKEAVSPHAES